jgi:hypothetical protein
MMQRAITELTWSTGRHPMAVPYYSAAAHQSHKDSWLWPVIVVPIQSRRSTSTERSSRSLGLIQTCISASTKNAQERCWWQAGCASSFRCRTWMLPPPTLPPIFQNPVLPCTPVSGRSSGPEMRKDSACVLSVAIGDNSSIGSGMPQETGLSEESTLRQNHQ